MSNGEQDCLNAVHTFLEAFRNLDWEPFCNSFAPDATFFFPPTARQPHRVEGKDFILAVFERVFANAREQKDHPPYIIIEPKDIQVHLGHNVGVVTFHLDDPDAFGRRTVVLENREGSWLIIHVHASNLPALV